MQILRTVGWVLLTAILVAFIAMNWTKVSVNFWPLQDAYLHFDWPVGLIALVFYLLGLVPMWLVYIAARWRHTRRISAMEAAQRNSALAETPVTDLQQASA